MRLANSYAGVTRGHVRGIEKSTIIKSFLSINKPCQFLKLRASILDCKGRGTSGSRGIGQSLAVADHVNETDITAIVRRIELPITERQSACIGERAKVEKWITSFD